MVPALILLRRFVESAVDALIRSSGDGKPGSIDSLHDQWLNALTATDGTDAGERRRSRHACLPNPAVAAAHSDFGQRALSSMFPPGGARSESGPWLILPLGGSRDPSLILPASEAWNLKAQGASALGKNAGAVREHLLASLGQAAESFTHRREPARADAGRLLCRRDRGPRISRGTASALEQSGFGVMLPGWWTRKGSNALKARAHVKSPKLQGGAGMSSNRSLPSTRGSPGRRGLFPIRNSRRWRVSKRRWCGCAASGWKWTRPKSRRLRFPETKSSGTATLGEIVKMSLELQSYREPGVRPGHGVGWIAELLAQLEGTAPFEELPQPTDLLGTLRPYQRRAIRGCNS